MSRQFIFVGGILRCSKYDFFDNLLSLIVAIGMAATSISRHKNKTAALPKPPLQEHKSMSAVRRLFSFCRRPAELFFIILLRKKLILCTQHFFNFSNIHFMEILCGIIEINQSFICETCFYQRSLVQFPANIYGLCFGEIYGIVCKFRR